MIIVIPQRNIWLVACSIWSAAETTFAGRLIGSGWHTAALGMRLLQQGPFKGGSSLGAPGIDELRWFTEAELRTPPPGVLLAPMLQFNAVPAIFD